jgi:hypothetical protein
LRRSVPPPPSSPFLSSDSEPHRSFTIYIRKQKRKKGA